jgi:hypothetical protein
MSHELPTTSSPDGQQGSGRRVGGTLLTGLWLSATALATPALAQHVPYGEDFAGHIGETRATSTPAFPRPAEALRPRPMSLSS